MVKFHPDRHGLGREIKQEVNKALSFYPPNLRQLIERCLYLPTYVFSFNSEDPNRVGTIRERKKKLRKCLGFMPKDIVTLISKSVTIPKYELYMKPKSDMRKPNLYTIYRGGTLFTRTSFYR